ncbi:terminase large subunit [Thalassoglobus sp. JC818]|uniref:terminase large subunit domain-containing protein n=1 Tax=Thalassoglobus sp. JC818 TaxID=3232136 RepID=UPI00345A7EB8
MTNFLSTSERKRLHSLIASAKARTLQRDLGEPERFRNRVLIPSEQLLPFSSVAAPWQIEDLGALDEAWKRLASGDVEPDANVIRRAYIERPRGHSKTSDMALQISWILLAAVRPVTGLAAAADRDQAKFLYDSIQRLTNANPNLFEELSFVQHQIKNKRTGSRLEVISSDVKSSFGALPDFVVCDELCHWEKPDMWYSLLSSAAKKSECVLSILTNAGVGKGWQWEVREHARQSSSWHFSSLDGPQAHWITDDWLQEQRSLLPEPVFERLWLNRWQHSDGNFVTLDEAEACRDSLLMYQVCGQPGIPYVATIDYAEKHDLTVGCVCHLDGEKVIVDRMDVVKPSPQNPTRIQWVEDWIEDIGSRFHRVRFVVDEYQLLSTIQRLENRYPIERFAFRAGGGNERLAVTLRQLILHQNVGWYADCGAVDGFHRDDLETELSSLLLRQTSRGRVRIDHIADGVHHDDRSFALGVACLALKDENHVEDHFVVTPPSLTGDFLW